jgi:hypothetical protein
LRRLLKIAGRINENILLSAVGVHASGLSLQSVTGPGVPDAQIGYDLTEAAGEISAAVEMFDVGIDNRNPVVLRRAVDAEIEIRRPPISLALIDECNQFRSGLFGSIDELHARVANGS